jgi:hypothetical protein
MFICWHNLCLTLLEIELMKELMLRHHYIFLEFFLFLSYWLNSCEFCFVINMLHRMCPGWNCSCEIGVFLGKHIAFV